MKNQFLKILAGMALTTVLLASCSEDSVSTTEDNQSKELTSSPTSSTSRPGSTLITVTTIDDFAINHLALCDEMEIILDSVNPNFTPYLDELLQATSNRKEREDILTNAGVSDAEGLLDVYDDIVSNKVALYELSTFRDLDIETQEELVSAAISDKFAQQNPYPPTTDADCHQIHMANLFACRLIHRLTVYTNAAAGLGIFVSANSGWYTCTEMAIDSYVACLKN